MTRPNSARRLAPARRGGQPDLPCQPRLLSVHERHRLDIYTFYSPKIERVVTQVGPLALAAALRFEFDCDIRHVVERPRRLVLTEKRRIDVSFWTRDRTGLERWWLVATSLMAEPRPGTLALKESRLFIEACSRSDLRLEIIFEAELLADRNRLDAYFRLLPYVQAARRLPAAAALAELVRGLLRSGQALTFRQIEQTLAPHPAFAVRSAVAALIHEGHLTCDLRTPLSLFTAIQEHRHGHS